MLEHDVVDSKMIEKLLMKKEWQFEKLQKKTTGSSKQGMKLSKLRFYSRILNLESRNPSSDGRKAV